MLCPRCQIQFNAGHWGECPHCGDPSSGVFVAELEGVVKTSTILISTDDGGVFHSIDDVPEPLRAKLASSTSGVNSATIVIADQGGRARIAAAMRNLPTHPEVPAPVPAIPPALSYWQRPNILWLGLILAGCTGGFVWYIYTRAL